MQREDLADDLARLAANHRWTWRPQTRRVLDRLPTAAHGLHPVAAVRRLDDAALDSLLGDEDWMSGLVAEAAALDRFLADRRDPEIAYFSPEFAVTELVPQYSGGLGVLAGDHLKAAGDLDLPLAGVGLFYHEGFFRQSVDGEGQTERYERHDPVEFGCEDTGLTVAVPMAHGEVNARVWRLDVGRSPLLLLDSDVPENSPADASICDRLYGAQRDHRLKQELLLGIGGARALAALGWRPRVVHLNEGHAGFVVLAMLDEVLANGDGDLAAARRRVKEKVVFTTHTPVPAGIELYERELVGPHLEVWAERWNVDVDRVFELGTEPLGSADVFNMTALCLLHARGANGVSRLHGEVSRNLFGGIPGGDRITSITNGVHARSWVHPELMELFDRRLGASWSEGDPAAWEKAATIEAPTITAVRRAGGARLVALVARRTGIALDPDALIVGFARRFAPYKRATLLLRHEERLLELLHDDERPLRLVYSGKAHPADDHGKALLAALLRFSRRSDIAGKVVFVPGYDMEVAAAMCAGTDVWLNTPVRPREASGTSGEKAALNGVLNCSILDGWWAEMFDGRNGWEIPASDAEDPERRDDEEAASALEVLRSITAEYFDSYDSGFVERIRHNWLSLGPRVTAARMVAEYRERLYRVNAARET